MFLGRKRIWLSSIVISLVLVLCLPLLVWASDSKEDLALARELTREFWLYPYDARLDRAADMPTFVEIMQEKDKWAYYFSAEELNSFIAEMEGSSLRFGFYLEIDDGLVTILSLAPGSPAAVAGIEAGGVITHIDGKDLSKLKADEILDLFWAQPEKEKTFRVKTDTGSKDYPLMPAEIEDAVINDMILEDNIGYIYIEVFAENLVDQFKKALVRLFDQGMTALILDLRDCPGGSLDAVLDLSGCFVPDKVPALHLMNRNRRSYPQYSKSWPEKIKVPIAVLINEDTASAAELLAANIQDNHAAVIFGWQSYGKGLVQQIVGLPGQGGFKLTTDKYLSSKYQDIDEQGGVHPDVTVADTYDENDSEGWGAVMSKALAWLRFQAGR
ncbi:MAG: S41 family peptidase, partial [Clostridiales bacterium]|nr:S41 family peptidase [Clostridiales bacterium]